MAWGERHSLADGILNSLREASGGPDGALGTQADSWQQSSLPFAAGGPQGPARPPAPQSRWDCLFEQRLHNQGGGCRAFWSLWSSLLICEC